MSGTSADDESCCDPKAEAEGAEQQAGEDAGDNQADEPEPAEAE